MTVRTRAEFFLLGTTFVWGSSFVVVKLIANDISSSLFIAVRFGIGALLFALFLAKQLHTIKRATLLRGIFLGGIVGSGIVIQNYGIYMTTASKSAFITGLMVIFTPIFQLLLERRAPKLGNIIGIIIITYGLYLLTSPTGSGINFGDVLVLISALIFGIYIVYLNIYAKGENVLHLSLIQVSMTTLIAAAAVPFENVNFNPTNVLIGMLLYMGICGTIVTTYVQTRFQKDTTPTRAVIIYTIEPVITSVLAYFLINELLGSIGIIGGALIIGGILVSEFSDVIFVKLGFKANMLEN
jgi:drug/metabolite transporter (DMT)-like permease